MGIKIMNTTPQDRYYEAMDVVTAPIRKLKSLIQTALILVTLVVVGLFFPLILFLTHHQITPTAWAVSGITLLTIITFVYTPGYTVIGGALFILTFVFVLVPIDVDWACGNFMHWVLIFLSFGLLQKLIRNWIRHGHRNYLNTITHLKRLR